MSKYVEKSHNGYVELDIATKQLDEGIIYLSGEINDNTLISFTEELLYLENKKDIQNIIILINSPGGLVSCGLSIIDLINNSNKDIITVCLSNAMSMAALILSAGQKRYALKSSKIMIHEPLIERTGGSATNICKTAESIQKTKDIIISILADNCNKDIKEIKDAISFDNYMNSKEAISFGIIDNILDKPISTLKEYIFE